MLRRPKHSKNEVVVPKEEEDWCHNMIYLAAGHKLQDYVFQPLSVITTEVS